MMKQTQERWVRRGCWSWCSDRVRADSFKNCHALQLRPMALLAHLLVLGEPHRAAPGTLFPAETAEEAGECVPSAGREAVVWVFLEVTWGLEGAERNGGVGEDSRVVVAHSRVHEDER